MPFAAVVMTPSDSEVSVLVVEDEGLTAFALARVLRECAYRVIGPVGRLQDAIELARATVPDAAILDVKLFGEFSFSLAEVLQGMGVPFLFCTGHGDLDWAPYWQASQAPVLTKPVKPDHLVGALRDLLALRRSPSTGANSMSPPLH
jgi:DNA-binding response OmpR family regulator